MCFKFLSVAQFHHHSFLHCEFSRLLNGIKTGHPHRISRWSVEAVQDSICTCQWFCLHDILPKNGRHWREILRVSFYIKGLFNRTMSISCTNWGGHLLSDDLTVHLHSIPWKIIPVSKYLCQMSNANTESV